MAHPEVVHRDAKDPLTEDDFSSVLVVAVLVPEDGFGVVVVEVVDGLLVGKLCAKTEKERRQQNKVQIPHIIGNL